MNRAPRRGGAGEGLRDLLVGSNKWNVQAVDANQPRLSVLKLPDPERLEIPNCQCLDAWAHRIAARPGMDNIELVKRKGF